MSTAELRQVADEYVAVATRFKQCGFGGVELHGAHGYLITQILSPWSNRRTDDYGGSLENRIRFVREVAQAIRQSCGADFVIGLKMPGDEGVAGGIDPDEAARITAALAQTGALDYFAYSQGNFTLSLENHAPDMHFRRGHFLDIHKKMRLAAAGTPGDGDRPHRDACRSRSRHRGRRGRSRRHDARADRGRRLAGQGARRPGR